ncbi:MAG: hypothetical protein QW228_07835 [Candidatus Aenigmatarchaeota archaeon]
MVKELLYWEVNRETKTAKMELQLLQKILEDAKPCGQWIEGRSPIGFWRCSLYLAADGVYLMKEWISAPGYSWSEFEVWKLKI